MFRLLKNLLRLADPEYAQLLERYVANSLLEEIDVNDMPRNMPLPYYALSNVLTLFSHDMPTLALIQHTFDYLLVRPPVASVYVAAAVGSCSRHLLRVSLACAGDSIAKGRDHLARGCG